MGNPKQQVLSRFFLPNPQPPPASPKQNPKPSPKIATTIPFSPSKTSSNRSLSHPQNPKPPKKSKPSLPQNPIPNPQNPKPTPLEHQFIDLKSQNPDVILMLQVGYRYRFFADDAEIAARVLGIIAHMDHSFLTASVPTFRLGFHVRRLVGAGYKVGVVKQMETAAIKAHGLNKLGPFERGLSALYTRATIEAMEDVGSGGSSEGNYMLCVTEREGVGGESGFEVKIGMVGVEISTGEVVYGEFNDSVMRSGLEAVVLSLSPAEIVLGEPLSATTEKVF